MNSFKCLRYRFCHIVCILIHSTVLIEHLICSWNLKIAKLNMTILLVLLFSQVNGWMDVL